jgi:hypothetical protein
MADAPTPDEVLDDITEALPPLPHEAVGGDDAPDPLGLFEGRGGMMSPDDMMGDMMGGDNGRY